LIPGVKDLFIDGAERPVQRSKNYKKQKIIILAKRKLMLEKILLLATKK
jgi:hypothetical protein